jgi:hypothetical protein
VYPYECTSILTHLEKANAARPWGAGRHLVAGLLLEEAVQLDEVQLDVLGIDLRNPITEAHATA